MRSASAEKSVTLKKPDSDVRVAYIQGKNHAGRTPPARIKVRVAVVCAQEEKALRIKAVRYASEFLAILVDDDTPAAHVAGCLRKGSQHGFTAILQEIVDVLVEWHRSRL